VVPSPRTTNVTATANSRQTPAVRSLATSRVAVNDGGRRAPRATASWVRRTLGRDTPRMTNPHQRPMSTGTERLQATCDSAGPSRSTRTWAPCGSQLHVFGKAAAVPTTTTNVPRGDQVHVSHVRRHSANSELNLTGCIQHSSIINNVPTHQLRYAQTMHKLSLSA
jgi:hypothetical protein